MPVKQLKEYLDSNHVKYATLPHSPAFTSQEIAATAHVPGKKLAKTIIVKSGNHLVMLVLSANEKINFAKLRKVVGEEVDLASESDFKDKFSGCEVGAMPPFGNLYNMPVYVTDALSHQDKILFNAGSHSELVQLAYTDFERLVHPKVVTI